MQDQTILHCDVCPIVMMDDGAEDGVVQLEDGQFLDTPDQTEDRDVDQSVQFKNVKRLQNMAVFPVDFDCHFACQTAQAEEKYQTCWIWSPVGDIQIRLRFRKVPCQC